MYRLLHLLLRLRLHLHLAHGDLHLRHLARGDGRHDHSRGGRGLEAAALAAPRARGDGGSEEDDDANHEAGDGAAVGWATF